MRTLLVELLQSGQSTMLQSVDVARHGVFVAHPSPPRERHMVMLNVHLPEGPIRATAVVTRVATHPSGVMGMGTQFFALAEDAKQRWDRFIAELDGAPPVPQDPSLPAARADIPLFFIRVRDEERLNEFFQSSVEPGHVELQTPLLKAVGSEVTLVVVHPVTQDEFLMRGLVEQVFQEKPKRMLLALQDMGLTRQGAFMAWVRNGQNAPTLPPLPPPVAPVPDGFVASTSGSYHRPHSPLLGRDTMAPADTDAFELDVDDGLFVSADDAIHDAATAPAPPREDSIPIIQGALLPPPPPPATVMPAREMMMRIHELAERLRKDNALVRVWCSHCVMPAATLDVGVPPGSVALFSEVRPHWCPACRVVAGGLRVDPAAGRQRLLNLLGQDVIQLMLGEVPLSFVYDALAMAQPPRCSWCGGWLQVTPGVQALDERVWWMREGEVQALAAGVGDCCPAPHWHVERLQRGAEPRVQARAPERAEFLSSQPAPNVPAPVETPVSKGDMDEDGLLVFKRGTGPRV